MQKFVLRMLLTSRVLRRPSARVGDAQAIAALMTMIFLVLVGIYAWIRSFN